MEQVYSVVAFVITTWSEDATGEVLVRQVNLPYSVTFTVAQRAAPVVLSLRPRPIVFTPKPVPITVTRVPPWEPPVLGETETKLGVKVRLWIVLNPLLFPSVKKTSAFAVVESLILVIVNLASDTLVTAVVVCFTPSM